VRGRYLVCYDIFDAGRLRKVFRTMRGFGAHRQFSVFICDLSAKELVELEIALVSVLNQREDRVMIVDLGPVSGRGATCVRYLGKRPDIQPAGAVVV